MRKLFLALLFIAQLNYTQETILLFGGRGWIGGKLLEIAKKQGHNVICAQSRLENRESVAREINEHKPTRIINAAGIIGKPNVDWCETHQQETIRTNVIGTLTLADTAYEHNIHLTNISTGCIYEYDSQHPMHSGKGFTEQEEPNFDGSFYSRTKIQMEKLILCYPNVLNLRVKMPISTEMDRGFVAKISKYKKLINVPNSITILDDLLPIALDMTIKETRGNFNFVNPGTLTHNQAMNLYKKHIDPTHTYENFSIEEQDKILKARRANAELSSEKLLSYYPNIPHVSESLEQLLKEIEGKR